MQPIYGTTYTGSSHKNAEHGGFSFGDTNVGLLVSNPSLKAAVVKTPVATSQVAATILHELGLDPQNLRSVKIEKTAVLPSRAASWTSPTASGMVLPVRWAWTTSAR